MNTTDQIIDWYKRGYSILKIANLLNSSHYKIRKVLQSNNIEIVRQKLLISEETINKVLELYSIDKTLKQVAEEVGCDERTVGKILKLNNISYLGRGHVSRLLKKNPFKPLSSDTYYWIGYIIGDGNLAKDKKRISIVSKDKEHLQKFVTFLNIDRELYKTKTSRCYVISFGNEEVYNQLLSYGITPKKSNTIQLTVPFNWDMLRGFFDADGAASKRDRSIKIVSGSYSLLIQVQEFLEEEGIKSRVYGDQNYFRLAVYDKANLRKVYKNFYTSNNTYLERKKEILGAIIE